MSNGGMASTGSSTRYLVYRDDGAVLVYSGTDQAGYRDARHQVAGEHAGALVGQSMMGRERWVLACYFRAEPPPDAIRRRREGGLLGLTWEAAE
jgi:hypothetical protein